MSRAADRAPGFVTGGAVGGRPFGRREGAGRRRRRPAAGPAAVPVILAALGAAAHAQPGPVPGAPAPVEPSGSAAAAGGGFAVAGVLDRPPPPAPPEVVARDEQGRVTVRAVRLVAGLRLDGVLDEPVYEAVPAISDFVQQMPVEGAPASERTDAWILFDAANVYVAARVWDSAPPSAWVANEMQRDTPQLRENDSFWVAFDTFNDRRNGVAFYTNPLGALGDFAITNEGNPNGDWNPVWDVRVGRFEGGWTVEMEIPFKSLRYRAGPAPPWGVQLRRLVRRKNEQTYLTPVPISAGRRGIFRVSDAALLTGLEPPDQGRVLEVKPYAIGGRAAVAAADPPIAWDGDGGVDAKYGVTRNLTLDLTWNTDFAQVEADEQQVNLTRFSLFFPEKREFFLEGRGIFDFARGGGPSSRDSTLRPIGGAGARGSFGAGNAPTLFYSRRIGLERGVVVPIVAGGRLTGKVGDFDVGALNIRTGERRLPGGGGPLAETTDFTVVRVKRDVLRRSAVGALFTNRSALPAGEGPGANRVFGADATLAFHDNVSVVGYFARTRTPGVEGRDTSYQGQFTYAGDRYGLTAEHLVVEDGFRPEVGFVRRDDFRRSYASGRFSPRPRAIEAIRQFRLEASHDHVRTADTGVLETRQTQVGFSAEFETSDRVGMTFADNYEFLASPFAPGPGVVLPVGGYGFRDVEATWTVGAQRRLTGIVTVRGGEYFDGRIRSVGFSRGRVALTPELSVEPTLSENWIDTPAGSFHTRLIVSRVTWTFSPRTFLGGLIQYNSAADTVNVNLRLRWEYSPGSELFVVYTEDRDADPLRPNRFDGFSALRSRGLVVKVNRLFRF